MSEMVATHQERFAEALLDPSRNIPIGLFSSSGAPPSRRFEVYRNNVARGLAQALAIRFPATESIVGKQFFAAMAREYGLSHPPNSPVLLDYGKELEDFVRSFPPAAELPYLPDIVKLENARMAAYHAADAAPLNPQVLTTLDPSRLEALKIALHPSFGLIRSAYPIVTIWAMNSGELPLAPIRDWLAEDAVIVRPHLTVLVRRLPAGGAAFLDALSKGQPLGAAVGIAQEDAIDFDLTANLVGLFTSGVVVAVSNDGATV
jgi:hypothetical protein